MSGGSDTYLTPPFGAEVGIGPGPGPGPGPSKLRLAALAAAAPPPPSSWGDGVRAAPPMRCTTLGLDGRGGAIVGIFRTRSTQSLGTAAADADTAGRAGVGMLFHLSSPDEDDGDDDGCLPPPGLVLVPAPPAAPPPVVGFHCWLAMTARGRGRAERRGGGDMEPDLRERPLSSLAWMRCDDESRGAKGAGGLEVGFELVLVRC